MPDNTNPHPQAPGQPAGPSPAKAAAALEQIGPELAALDPVALTPININVPVAVSIVLGSVERLMTLRPAIVAGLPNHPVAWLDQFETYALAALWAHVLETSRSVDAQKLPPLLVEARKLRMDLLVAAEALAQRHLLDPVAVAAIRSGHGNVDMANDLVALAGLFSGVWFKVQGKTAVEPAEIERAAELGTQILAAVGTRKRGAKNDEAALQSHDRLVRATTLLIRAYDECLRAVTYLRWHEDDVRDWLPSIYVHKRPSRPAETKADADAIAPAAAPSGEP